MDHDPTGGVGGVKKGDHLNAVQCPVSIGGHSCHGQVVWICPYIQPLGRGPMGSHWAVQRGTLLANHHVLYTSVVG